MPLRASRTFTPRASSCLAALLLLPGCASTAGNDDPLKHATPAPVAKSRAGRIVQYHPGLLIDYRVPRIEIDAEVVLREGPLELFAYAKAPVPKEHESILRTMVPAEMIYQALGLIGLAPGHPPKYFMESQTARPASGDPVEVLVRVDRQGRIVEESACKWMWDVTRKAPMEASNWVFCGSERSPDGRLAASEEGTLVTVVDFPSALLALPSRHSDSDAQLWLKAHTPAIPAVGTTVTLVLQPAPAAKGEVTPSSQLSETE